MPSMNQNDFDKMCENINHTVNQIGKLVEENMSKFGATITEKVKDAIPPNYQNGPDNPKPPNPDDRIYGPPTGKPVYKSGNNTYMSFANNFMSKYTDKRYNNRKGLRISGILITLLGGALIFSWLAGILSFITEGYNFGANGAGNTGWIIAIVGAIVTGGLSIWVLKAGIKRIRLADLLNSIKRIFGTRDVCTFDEIANQLHTSKKKTIKAMKTLLKHGLFPEGHIDDEVTCLMLTDSAYSLYRQTKGEYERKLSEEAESEKARQLAREKTLSSLDQETKAFVKEGHNYLKRLQELDLAIDDEDVSSKIVQIETDIERILCRVEEEPQIVDSLDKLMGYYLPTTVKLLKAYDELEEQPIQGENIRTSREEIGSTLDVLHRAYVKLLDMTYADMSMDVSADISVLNTVLAQEGLTRSPLDRIDFGDDKHDKHGRNDRQDKNDKA